MCLSLTPRNQWVQTRLNVILHFTLIIFEFVVFGSVLLKTACPQTPLQEGAVIGPFSIHISYWAI